MSTEVIEGNKLIAEFMGLKIGGGLGKLTAIKNGQYCNPKYHSSWDWLIPACYKWDNLFKETAIAYPKYLQYEKLCVSLDNAVTLYKILPAFNQLVENIKWYQNQILNNILIKVNHG